MEENNSPSPAQPLFFAEADFTKVILDMYSPCSDAAIADKRLSTHDIFRQLQSLFQSDLYDEYDIFQLLKKLEFSYFDTGNGFVWLLTDK